jgi:Cys-tRNA synthase (O-phospho-L-seryl-tRNA:Cys-tRNA synthase)
MLKLIDLQAGSEEKNTKTNPPIGVLASSMRFSQQSGHKSNPTLGLKLPSTGNRSEIKPKDQSVLGCSDRPANVDDLP